MYRKYKSGRFTNNKTKTVRTMGETKDTEIKKSVKNGVKTSDKNYKNNYLDDYYYDN
jgi:hypothetical protein